MSARRFRKLEFLRRAGHLLQRHLPLCRRGSAGQPEPGKGRHVHQHGAAHPAALSGVRAARRTAGPIGEIIQDIANRLGANWNYAHPSEIYGEIASLTPLLAGVTYERLEGYKSLQWPVAADGTDQPLLYTKQFTFPDGKAKLLPAALDASRPTSRTRNYDLHLNNGRLLEHFHEGNMTYRSEGIREKTPDTFVEVSPELARKRGIQTARWVRAHFALRPGARAGAGHRPRAGQGALHADELGQGAGQPADSV